MWNWRRSYGILESRIGASRLSRQSDSFIWFVLFVWLHETHQMNQIKQIDKANQTTKQTGLVSDLKVLPLRPSTENGLHDGRSKARVWELFYGKCSYRIHASVLDAMNAGSVSGESHVFLLCPW